MEAPARRLGPTATALALAAALLVGCGSKTLPGSAVSQRISAGLERQVGERPGAVRCPKEIEAKPGQRARCKIVGSDGSEIGLTVVMKDDRGRFDYVVDKTLSKQPRPKAKG